MGLKRFLLIQADRPAYFPELELRQLGMNWQELEETEHKLPGIGGLSSPWSFLMRIGGHNLDSLAQIGCVK